MDDTFTASGDDDPRAARIGRILDEICSQRARGVAVEESEILARNPDLADELRPHLALLRQLHGTRGPADELIARGVLGRSADGTYCGQIGPYKVLELIGRGGMGLVFKAYDDSLKRTVALKLLRPELADDAAAQTAHEKSVIQRQIDTTDRQIDQLVYELYGLTDDEIRIVEEATQR